MKKPNGQQDHSPSSLVEVLNFNPFYHNRRVSSHNSHPLTHHTSIHSTFNFWRSKSVNSFNKRVRSRILFQGPVNHIDWGYLFLHESYRTSVLILVLNHRRPFLSTQSRKSFFELDLLRTIFSTL